MNISSESKTKTESTVKEVRINYLCEVVAKLVESLTLIGVCLSLSAKKAKLFNIFYHPNMFTLAISH